ncbi:MAG TPA: hypothetical protein VF132_13450 [Rudaea sp.]
MFRLAFKTFAIFLGLSSSIGQAADDYRLKVKVERDGVLVVDSIVEAPLSGPIDLLVTPGSNEKDAADDSAHSVTQRGGSARLIARLKDLDTGDVEVDIQYLEKRHGDWALLGEPSIVAPLGVEANVQFSAESTPIGVEHFAFFVTAEKVRTAPKNDNRSPLTELNCKGNADLLGAGSKCCSTKAMTCCGVKNCCDNRPGQGDCCETKLLPQ